MTKLGDVARECRQNWTGDQAGVPIVGLEHLVPGEYELKAWDSDIEHTFSKKFEKSLDRVGLVWYYQINLRGKWVKGETAMTELLIKLVRKNFRFGRMCCRCRK